MSTRRKPPSRNPATGGHVAGTGIKVEVTNRHNATIPEQKPGEHLWVTLGMWRTSFAEALDGHERGAAINLDHESLLTIEGPACYWCEQPFSPELATQPCPGEPEES